MVAELVTREGTDYGDQVFTLDEKIAAVLAQLRSGRARIEFDPENESCNVVAAR